MKDATWVTHRVSIIVKVKCYVYPNLGTSSDTLRLNVNVNVGHG